MKSSFYLLIGKPLFDFVVSLFGIIVFTPFFLIIAVVIKLSSKGSILFKQERAGLNFKPFNIFKFRTMVANAEKLGEAVTTSGDLRITRIGRILRNLKLDELPQLFNVLFGQMSIVGPRPEVMKYVSQFKGDYSHILKVKPGITDYAALKYRNEEEIMAKYDNVELGYIEEVLPAKIKLYRKYIEEISFLTDLKLVFKTLIRIVR